MTDHYFSAEPSSRLETAAATARIWGHELRLETARGVFAHGRLDTGTAVLVREAGPPRHGDTFLDLGCGYGVLACALAVERPEARVWAVDVNERALAMTRANAERLGVAARLYAARPSEVPREVRFDGIWSNPPIRVGKSALHEILLHWLPRLREGGEAMLVVSRHLGADSLQGWLADQGFDCHRAASAKGFRVLRIRSGQSDGAESSSSSQSQ